MQMIVLTVAKLRHEDVGGFPFPQFFLSEEAREAIYDEWYSPSKGKYKYRSTMTSSLPLDDCGARRKFTVDFVSWVVSFGVPSTVDRYARFQFKNKIPNFF